MFFGYVIIEWSKASHGYLILTISLLLFLITIVDLVFLVPSPEREVVVNIEVENNSDR